MTLVEIAVFVAIVVWLFSTVRVTTNALATQLYWDRWDMLVTFLVAGAMMALFYGALVLLAYAVIWLVP